MLSWSILQYFRPSISYHLSLRTLFCLFLSGCLRQVLLYVTFILFLLDSEPYLHPFTLFSEHISVTSIKRGFKIRFNQMEISDVGHIFALPNQNLALQRLIYLVVRGNFVELSYDDRLKENKQTAKSIQNE